MVEACCEPVSVTSNISNYLGEVSHRGISSPGAALKFVKSKLHLTRAQSPLMYCFRVLGEEESEQDFWLRNGRKPLVFSHTAPSHRGHQNAFPRHPSRIGEIPLHTSNLMVFLMAARRSLGWRYHHGVVGRGDQSRRESRQGDDAGATVLQRRLERETAVRKMCGKVATRSAKR